MNENKIIPFGICITMIAMLISYLNKNYYGILVNGFLYIGLHIKELRK